MRYKKRDEFVEAVQWSVGLEHDKVKSCHERHEADDQYCVRCGKPITEHGDGLLAGAAGSTGFCCVARICPSDWIVANEAVLRIFTPEEFEAQYEPAPIPTP